MWIVNQDKRYVSRVEFVANEMFSVQRGTLCTIKNCCVGVDVEHNWHIYLWLVMVHEGEGRGGRQNNKLETS